MVLLTRIPTLKIYWNNVKSQYTGQPYLGICPLKFPGSLYFHNSKTHYFHHSLLNVLYHLPLLLQPLPATLEQPGCLDVFEDVENPLSSRSSESGFTDFVQYLGDGPQETESIPHSHSAVKAGRRSSGPSQTKPVDKPVMQCCLEHFQQFLSRLISLYITPGRVDRPEDERTEVMRSGPLVSEGPQHCDYTEMCSEGGLVHREYVAAFTAACQLFLECSSFPVYIAEGNLKSSPTQEEQLGKNQKHIIIIRPMSFWKYLKYVWCCYA